MNNLEGWSNKSNDSEIEEGSFTSIENLERSLERFENELAAYERLPLFADQVEDVKKAISNLKTLIASQKN